MTEDSAYYEQRQTMVETQIIPRGIKDKSVLEAMRSVKRHLFVPDNVQSMAYMDEPLPIGHGQTISQPYIVAYMTEALMLKGSEKVLEIGTGSGYQAAVLAHIVKDVYSIEILEPLCQFARENLLRNAITNVQCKAGDGYRGWSEFAPYDAIILTAAPPEIPAPLLKQLKDGGRLIAPVGKWVQDLILITRRNDSFERKRLLPVRFVPMTGKAQETGEGRI